MSCFDFDENFALLWGWDRTLDVHDGLFELCNGDCLLLSRGHFCFELRLCGGVSDDDQRWEYL